MTLQAGAPLPLLVSKLSLAGYGYLAGPELKSARAVLHGLSRLLDPRTGAGKATAWDIAQASGYKDRATRYALNHLEEIGLIERERGYVAPSGRQPSRFRINKALLLEWITEARPALEIARALHKQATDARLRGLSYVKRRTNRHKRRSSHVALSANPLSKEEFSGPVRAPEEPRTVTDDERTAYLAQCRAQIRAAR